MKFLNKLLNNTEKRTLASNFSALFVLQLLDYVLPLITVPYIIRVIGLEKLGVTSFAGAIILYLNILVAFGFGLTAVRDIATHRNNAEKVSEIFSSVTIIKFLLMIFSLIILLLLMACFEKIRNEWIVYVFTFGLVVSNVLSTAWIFQGFEQMKTTTYFNAASKLFFVLCMFVFIKEEKDYILGPLFSSLGGIIANAIMLYIGFTRFGLKFRLQPFFKLKECFLSSFTIFVSNIASLSYRNLNAIILGILTNDITVGCYAVAEKLIYAAQRLQSVFDNAMFPYVSRKVKENKKYFFDLSKKYAKVLAGLYFVFTFLIFIFAPIIISVFAGEKNQEIILNLRIFSFVIIFSGLNYYFGVLGLVTMGYKKEFAQCVINTAIFSIVMCCILVYLLQGAGAALTMVLSELFLLILIFLKIYNIKHRELQ